MDQSGVILFKICAWMKSLGIYFTSESLSNHRIQSNDCYGTHIRFGTIDSNNMYESDLTITRLHQLLTACKGRWLTPSCCRNFCCNSESNEKTQPYHWPTKTLQQILDKETKINKNGKERGKTKDKRAYKELPTHKKFPTHRNRSKVISKMPKAGILNKDFSLTTNPLVFFKITSKR